MLRLQADLRWLEACEQNWIDPKEWIVSDTDNAPVLRARGLRKHTATEKDWCVPSTGLNSMSRRARRWR